MPELPEVETIVTDLKRFIKGLTITNAWTDVPSFKKIRKLLDVTELRIATPEEFRKVTGLEIGTARFYVPGIKTYIDQKVFEKKTILGGTGSLTTTFQCQSEDLKKLPGIQVVDVTSEIEEIKTNLKLAKRVLSGIRATGRLHLGNYLGAIKGMIELQNNSDYETLYMVADVHTITTPYKVEELKANRRDVLIDYLAAGLNPEKSIIFFQSDVPEHLELAFYFSSVTTIARMLHLPTYKDKIKQYPNANTVALLNYPILMASDILVYKAGFVPVGIDQEPHLEVAREIARKMNQLYGTDFPEPIRFATKGEKVPSLKGEGKMSKTVEGSYINLTDSREIIQKKIRSIPTQSVISGPMTAGTASLFSLASLYFPPEKMIEYENKYHSGTLKFSDLKDDTSAEIFSKDLSEFQTMRNNIAGNKHYVDKVIKEGAERARKIARETVKEVKQKMGLL